MVLPLQAVMEIVFSFLHLVGVVVLQSNIVTNMVIIGLQPREMSNLPLGYCFPETRC